MIRIDYAFKNVLICPIPGGLMSCEFADFACLDTDIAFLVVSLSAIVFLV